MADQGSILHNGGADPSISPPIFTGLIVCVVIGGLAASILISMFVWSHYRRRNGKKIEVSELPITVQQREISPPLPAYSRNSKLTRQIPVKPTLTLDTRNIQPSYAPKPIQRVDLPPSPPSRSRWSSMVGTKSDFHLKNKELDSPSSVYH